MFARGNEVRPFVRAKPRSAFATPLGDVAVDVGRMEFLRDAGLVTIDETPHTPEHVSMTGATSLLGDDWQSPERALEIQLALRLHRLRTGG